MSAVLPGAHGVTKSTTTTKAKPLSHKEYIANVDSLCVFATRAMTLGFARNFPKGIPTELADKVKYVKVVLIPVMAQQWKAIFAIEPPKKDKELITDLKIDTDKEMKNLRLHPDDAVYKDPFPNTNLALSDFGFKECPRNKQKAQTGVSGNAPAQH